MVNNKIVEKPSIKDVQSFDNSFDYDFEPMSYDESGYDPYAAYDLGESTKSTGGKITLKDGNTYTLDQLNTKMLVSMGYTIQESGKIIKNKC